MNDDILCIVFLDVSEDLISLEKFINYFIDIIQQLLITKLKKALLEISAN